MFENLEGVAEGEEKSNSSVTEDASDHKAAATSAADSSDEDSSNLKPRKSTQSRRPSMPMMVCVCVCCHTTSFASLIVCYVLHSNKER
jgi:hypothetical protein